QAVRIVPAASLRRGNLHGTQQIDAGLRGGARTHARVQAKRLADLSVDAMDRIEGGHRFLEDHRHLVAPDTSHAPLAEPEQVATVEVDLAPGDAARLLD